jgi:hypothetical protein
VLSAPLHNFREDALVGRVHERHELSVASEATDPSEPHTITQDFSPDWMELAPGDSLVLHSWCRHVNGGRTPQGHHVGSIWWSETP